MPSGGRRIPEVKINDSDEDEIQISEVGNIFSSTAIHLRINSDKEYFVCYEWVAVAGGSTVTLSIVTLDTHPHGELKIASNEEFSYKIDVGTTPPDGEEIYPHNLNRACNKNRCEAKFFYDETYGDKDIQLECGHAGGTAKFDSVSTNDIGNYWLLDSSATYHIRITNESESEAYVIIKYRYHEHEEIKECDGDGEDENEYDYEPI